jgi:hypothetical protein
MTKLPLLPDRYYDELISHNGNFYNGLMFNFNKPQIYNYTPFEQALLGEFIINKRNHIGKYQGNYILYALNDICYIRIKILSIDKKCELKIMNANGELDDKLKFEEDAIIMEFKNFIELLNNNMLYLENI